VNPIVHEMLTTRGGPPLAAIRTALLETRPAKRRTQSFEAALDLAVSFRTWQTLVRGGGLSPAAAADLVARMVACA
jgi:hypothetical protein